MPRGIYKHKKHSEETKRKISESHMGDKNPQYGKSSWNKNIPHSEETKNKMSLNHANFSGENNPRWKGGEKLRQLRIDSKRRELGNINLNIPLECTVGHHINMDYIVYVPIWINKIPHNVRTEKKLGYVNALTLLWLIYTEEINNCKEV